jgi:hypothetical protein
MFMCGRAPESTRLVVLAVDHEGNVADLRLTGTCGAGQTSRANNSFESSRPRVVMVIRPSA